MQAGNLEVKTTATRERSRVRRALQVAFEFVLALLLVTVFFGVLLGVLTLSFPSGATLQDLIKYEQLIHTSFEEPDYELALPEGEIPLVAMLSDTYRKVQDRAAGSFAWSESHRGTRLQQRHAVQTYARSGATIAFDEHNQLKLGENALMIVRDLKERRESKRIHASAVIIEGEFHGRFGGDRESVDLELETEKGTYEVESSRGVPADFRVKVNRDQSSTFSVFEGEATFRSGTAQVRIPANHAVSVDASGAVSALVRLPSKPRPVRPKDGKRVEFRSRPPAVSFGWKKVADAEGYRFVLARDPAFRRVVHDQIVERTTFKHGNLAPGTYYWKVIARSAAADSPPSEPRSLTVVRDADPPRIDVAFPAGPQMTGSLVLRGSVDKDARVFLRDVEVPVDDSGEFEVAVNLRPGLNLLVIEAIDPAGNAAYVSRVLNATAEP